MKKIKKKVSKFFKNYASNYAENASYFAVQHAIKKDLLKKSISYKKAIDEWFPHYLNNYVKVCKYLYNDFNISEATFNNEKTDIVIETDLHNIVKKQFKGTIPLKVKFMDKIKLNKTIKKWWVLSSILEHYPDSLKLLKKCANSNIYKDIDITDEENKYTENEYLIEDFTIIENGSN